MGADKERIPLLKTKLYTPLLHPNLVTRPRLLARLEEALRQQHHLTLISARAGAGKTTLVSDWLHHQEQPFAWLSLDEYDDDPARFLSYLVDTFQQLGISVGYAALDEGGSSQLPSARDLGTELINDIAACPVPFILVLDDYQLIQNRWVNDLVGYVIDHHPPAMHLVLITRADPMLPLAHLRARGQLTEVRDHDLRFTPEEVKEFINIVMGLDLPVEALETIGRKTEGWIAGLRMAGISLLGHQQKGDVAAFIAAFGGTNRFILDYLMEEVLDQQTSEMQNFLIETSILSKMCEGLCDAVRATELEPSGSQSLLTELERTNLFVIPLDEERRWYRYHHLFADLLQSILGQRRSADQIRELHRRAARWYQTNHLLADAMNHIMAARDFEQAAGMIEENIAGLIHAFSRSNGPLLLSWIEKLPGEIRRSRPWIDIYRASILALNLQLDEVGPILDEVERHIDPGSPRAGEIQAHIAAVRAYSANLRGDAGQAIEMAALVRKMLPAREFLATHGMVAYTLADTYFATDDMENASRELLALIEIGKEADQLVITVPALCELAAVRKTQGRLYAADDLYERAYALLVQRNNLESRVICSYEFGKADLLRERNQLEAAHAHVMTGIEYRRRLGGYNLIGELTLMRVLQAQGDVDGAMHALHDAERMVRSLPFQLALMIEFRTARVLQHLAVGDVKTAARWADECGGGSEREEIALAKLLLAQGQAAEAEEHLTRQRSLADAAGRTGRLIEILALQSMAWDAQGYSTEAESILSKAISLSEPEGYRRVFLDLGHPLRAILERLVSQSPEIGGPSRAILDLFPREKESKTGTSPRVQTEALINPLTRRELEVLQLLAEGLSNKEIASRLVVTPGTIKQHLKNICRKLEVHGRMQAVRRGRELNLI